MEIYVRSMQGHETITLKVNPTDTIKTVKEMLIEKGKYPATMLMFDGKELEDGATLSDYNIQDANILHSDETRLPDMIPKEEVNQLKSEKSQLKEENAQLKADMAKLTNPHEVKIKICVYTFDDKTITLEVKPSDTIKKVKQMIRGIERYPVLDLMLMFDGRRLQNDCAHLKDYDIEDGSTLFAFLQQYGD